MMIFTTRFSRKKAALAVLLFGVVCAALILLTGREAKPESTEVPQLLSSEDCAAYLQSYGWTVAAEPVETLQFLLPEILEEPYLSYNALQLTQGFDLAAHCGKQLTRYTFTVTNYPDRPDGVQANLYVCEDAPVAGDILCTGANGFQEGLAFPKTDGKAA